MWRDQGKAFSEVLLPGLKAGDGGLPTAVSPRTAKEKLGHLLKILSVATLSKPVGAAAEKDEKERNATEGSQDANGKLLPRKKGAGGEVGPA